MFNRVSPKSAVLAALLATVSGQAASAAVLNYDEAIDGELGFASTTFTLDMAGSNVVEGSGFQSASGFDNDTFFLTVASGISIDSITYSISNGSSVGGTGVFSLTYSTQELDSGTFLQNVVGDLATNTVSDLTPPVATPYTFTDYRIWFGGFSTNGRIDSATWDWRIDIETSSIAAVPLPAGLPLLLAGLLGFGLVRRRNKG